MLQDTFDRLRGLTLVGLAVAWQAGILLNSFLGISSFLLIAGAGISFLCVLLFYRDPFPRVLALLLLCLGAGAWRYGSVLPANDERAILKFVGPARISVRGVVAEEPRLRGGHSRLLIVETSAVSQGNAARWTAVHGKVEVQVLGTEVEDSYGANYGDTLELQGKLEAVAPQSPPGIFASMTFPRVRVKGSTGNPLISSLYHFRNICATLILRTLPQPAAALLIAIVLGLRTPGLAPLTFAFNVTGTAHLIVPSGFKVTIVAGVVASGTRWLHRVGLSGPARAPGAQHWRHWIATTLVLLSIAAYTVLSGAGPAAIRAGIMGSLLVLAPRIGRNYNVYTALGLSSMLMSGLDPFVLWDAGFQLSFLGTLGIVLFTPSLQLFMRPLEALPLGHIGNEMIAVTLAAQFATLPIFAVTFQQISFIAPIANLLTVPLLGIFIVLGLFICGIGLVSLTLAQICGWVAWPLLAYVSQCILWCANLPGAYISVSHVSSGLAWAYYLLLASVTGLMLSQRVQKEGALLPQGHASGKKIWRVVQLCAASLFIGATGLASLGPQSTGPLSVTFLDVGPAGAPSQGQAIFIRTPDNKTVLIDGGSDAASLGQALDSRLPSWQRSLDMVILTTPRHEQLIGLLDIVTRYHIGAVYDAGMLHPSTTYAHWRRIISERGMHYTRIASGETIQVGTAVILQALWPTTTLHKDSNEVRDNGLILRLVAPRLRMLFLGASAQSPYALLKLAEQWPPNALQSEIVQIIGGKTRDFVPELQEVLRRAQPALLIVTPEAMSPAQKKLLLPSAETPASLPAGIQIVKTEQAGSVEIKSTGAKWNIDTVARA